jgi:hypothetical protein
MLSTSSPRRIRMSRFSHHSAQPYFAQFPLLHITEETVSANNRPLLPLCRNQMWCTAGWNFSFWYNDDSVCMHVCVCVCVLLNNTVNYQDYRVSITGEWISTVYWKNYTDKGQLRDFEESMCQCNFVQHKSHMNHPGIRTRPPSYGRVTNCLSLDMASLCG